MTVAAPYDDYLDDERHLKQIMPDVVWLSDPGSTGSSPTSRRSDIRPLASDISGIRFIRQGIMTVHSSFDACWVRCGSS